MTTLRPFGEWKSPISADLIASRRIRLYDVAIDGADIYWSESRPQEKGRYAIVRHGGSGEAIDINPAPFNARTRIHEYGGAAFGVFDGSTFFTNYRDQRVYRVAKGSSPQEVTTDDDVRHGDFVLDRQRSRLIAVREDTLGNPAEPRNAIATIALDGRNRGASEILVEGADFYSNPRLSPDGAHLAWIEWQHPNMPWDGTQLWTGVVDEDGAIVDRRHIAGGRDESIFQPEWSPDGVLHFVSDRTGWWNLYRREADQDINLAPDDAEYGSPAWTLGTSTYAFAADGRIVAASTRNGGWRLDIIDPVTREASEVQLPSTEISRVLAGDGFAVAVVSSPVEASALVRIDLSSGSVSVLRSSSDVEIERPFLSVPGSLSFPTTDGQISHGFFYPPQNGDFHAPEGELPPLIVESHGGPTGSSGTGLDLPIQFWTSRGFAVLDVNYRGSTGYGRAYQRSLQGKWGLYDVDDCIAGARYLADEGLVDPDRLLIHGWSASGYTTLAALTFHDSFRAGASHYGISDLEAMVRDTHKFESRYLDGLIGPWPEAKASYDARSPLHHVEQLSCPLILLQGLEDKVVPPNQAAMMLDAVNEKGLPVAMILFEGEQHGFRQSQNIKRALEAELFFYGRVLGFEPADELEPVDILNLPPQAP
ncbi:MAG: prolyl oligopeptidase family serine peptidase [Thermomicrobiales bacterium]